MRRSAVLLTLAVAMPCVVGAGSAPGQTTHVSFGRQTTWRFFDKGAEPNPRWRDNDFDDSAWASGPAPLGYGERGLNTTVGFGGDPKARHITTYFRHSFRVARAKDVSQLLFLIRGDDGLIVHLNGKEIIRVNLVEGAVNSKTVAKRDLEGLDERIYRRFTTPASALVAGKNVLAVEVHQSGPGSGDLFLDLVLRSYRSGEETRPMLKKQAKPAASAYHRKHYVAPGVVIPDGYVDGGRGMKLDAAGRARSHREVIVVDRSRDAFLRKHLAFAGSKTVGALKPADRARRLAKYVSADISGGGDRRSLQATGRLVREYSSRGVLIGEVARLCGATVCRHRALLYKLLADEAGLRVSLVRGYYNKGSRAGGHAWNELYLADGKKMIVDTMKSPRGAVFPQSDAKQAGRYLTIRRKPMYKPDPPPPDSGGNKTP